MSVSMENQERDGDKKHKDDDMDKLIKQIINVVPAIILKSNSLLDLKITRSSHPHSSVGNKDQFFSSVFYS